MAKTKEEAAPEPTLYRALMRRSEFGIGIVEEGDEVELPFDAAQIAYFVFTNKYAPVGELPADVAEALELFKAG